MARALEAVAEPYTYTQALQLAYSCKVGIDGKEKNRWAVDLPAGGMVIGTSKEQVARNAVVATGGERSWLKAK